MAWVAADFYGNESIYEYRPIKGTAIWLVDFDYVMIPKGSIAKLIGRELTWDDEPVELVETKDKE